MKNYHLALIRILNDLKPGKLLDAGSGGDSVGRILKDRGFDVVSLDLYGEPYLKDRFVRADMNKSLPFKYGVFDYIIGSETLQYLENHAQVFREFQRILKIGGGVYLTIPNMLHVSSRLYFFQNGYFSHFQPIRTINPNKEWDKLPYHPISFVEIQELSKRNRLNIEFIKTSSIKGGALIFILYFILKVLYFSRLFFQKDILRKNLLKNLLSKELLLGDHLIIKLVKDDFSFEK